MFEHTYTDIQPTSMNGLLRAMNSAHKELSRDGHRSDEIAVGEKCRQHYEDTLWAIQPEAHPIHRHTLDHFVFMGISVKPMESMPPGQMEFRQNGKVVARVTYLGID